MLTVKMGWMKRLRDENNGGFCISGAEPFGFASTVLVSFLNKNKRYKCTVLCMIVLCKLNECKIPEFNA